MHRPFAAQAIRQLIQQHAEQDPEALFEIASSFRNALAHGQRLTMVEEEMGVELKEIVDGLAQVAWRVLMKFTTPPRLNSPEASLSVIRWNTVLHRRMVVTLAMSIGSPIDREPRFEDIPEMKITVNREPAPPTPPAAEPD
jgi:hypothetical protein